VSSRTAAAVSYWKGDSGKERLLITDPKSLRERFNIDVRVNSEAVAIDRAAHHVTVTGPLPRHQKRFRMTADPFPGAAAFSRNCRGWGCRAYHAADHQRHDAILEHIERGKGEKGRGHRRRIHRARGAENLALRGIGVSIVEARRQLLPPLDRNQLITGIAPTTGSGFFLEKKVRPDGNQGRSVAFIFGRGPARSELVLLSIGCAAHGAREGSGARARQ